MADHKCIEKERLDRFDARIEKIFDKLDEIAINTASLPELKKEIKANSEFRLQAKGIIGGITFVSMLFGSFIVWAFSKLFGNR